MHESLAALFLMFRGAGPGATSGYPYQLLSEPNGITVSYKHESSETLVFLRAAPSGASLTAVRGFGSGRQEFVEAALESSRVTSLGFVENAALLYPVLAPDRQHAAALIVPKRLDMPPTGQSSATLVVFPVIENRAPTQIQTFQQIDDSLPVAPFDWSSDGLTLSYTARVGREEVIQSYSLRTSTRQTIGKGVFPRSSHNTRLLAHIDGRSIVLRDQNSGSIRRVHKTSWPIEWLDWHPKKGVLAISEKGPAYRSRLSLLDAETGESTALIETGIVQDLSWIAVPIRWEPYSQ